MENFTGVSLNNYFIAVEEHAELEGAFLMPPEYYCDDGRIKYQDWIEAVRMFLRPGYYRYYIRWVKVGGGMGMSIIGSPGLPTGEKYDAVIAFCNSIRKIQITQAHNSEYKIAKLLDREKKLSHSYI